MARGRAFDFAAGGWVVAGALLLSAAAVIWQLSFIWQKPHSRATGDGRTPASYGFDLSSSRIPLEDIIASGMPKDGLRALSSPRIVDGSDIGNIDQGRRKKFLVSGDRVIGVTLGGQARAYPLRVLNWHEVVNDELGGYAIAVTYSPLCDSSVVFDRELKGGRVEFGVSGLLYNSNLLMYDRRAGSEGESLWSQLKLAAVVGPAARAGQRLSVLPAAVVRWADWKARYPQTTVITGLPELAAAYRRNPYISYYGSDSLRFPARPLPVAGEWRRKTPVVVVRGAQQRVVFPLPLVRSKADAAGRWATRVEGMDLRFNYRDRPPTVLVESVSQDLRLEVVYSFWFAWYSMHPSDKVWSEGWTSPARLD